MSAARWFLLILILCSSLAGCEKLHIIKDSDNVVGVRTGDEEMNRIISEARSSVSQFLAVLKQPKPNQRDFSVKFPFSTDPGSASNIEHIWLSQIENKDGKYYGTVANDPYYIAKMKLGDVVEFDPQKISDWKYVEDDRLVGGKSIVFMLKNVSKEERAQVLSEIDFDIPELEDTK
jgi:uncharacterized protein YegJ (DUF2314 family)